MTSVYSDIVKGVDLVHSTVCLRKDGILEIVCSDDTIMEVHHIREVLKATNEIGNGKRFPTITMAGKYTTVTKEAREFMATKEAVQFSIVEAYVIQSLAQKILANFYLKFNKPPVKTKIFTDKTKAILWLRTFVQ